jgi:hypothetical protein
VYVTGYSDATWGNPVSTHAGGYDAFEAKLDSSGNLVWNTFLGSTDDDYGYGIAVDASSNLYVTGLSTDTWGSPVRAHAGNWDAFVAKLFQPCENAADCTDDVFCNGAEQCEAGECISGVEPCFEDEICKEDSDKCQNEWDLDEDNDVDKDDANLLKLQQKTEKTVLSSQHKVEKEAMKAAMGSSGDCDEEMDLDGDCDVDKDDASILKSRQKEEKTNLKEKHTAEKAEMKAALQ